MWCMWIGINKLVTLGTGGMLFMEWNPLATFIIVMSNGFIREEIPEKHAGAVKREISWPGKELLTI